MVYTTITFGDVTLNVTSMSVERNQKTRKTMIGKTLAESNIIGLNDKQWEINISGNITAETPELLEQKRYEIEELDNGEQYEYSDGLREGMFVVRPGTLVFRDESTDVNQIYRYEMAIVEW
jgi:hypothetical protein